MTIDNEKERTIYRTPEGREPSLFDYFVKYGIPEIFRFTEYVTFAAFIMYLALKTDSKLLGVFSAVLYSCVQFYVVDKQTTFIKKLEFHNVWTMRIASWILLLVGAAVLLGSFLLVMSIASAQHSK